MKKQHRLLALALCLLLLCTLALPAGAKKDAPTIKNVIFMIGDGMGENHLLLAREQGYELFMDTAYDLRGQSKTRSASDEVTDSAAGATALSCGVRTKNRFLATYWFDPSGKVMQPRIITEVAQAHGMKTGIVTTDKTSGATPAGYSAHVEDRDMVAEISFSQFESGIDLIWGTKESAADRAAAEENGYTYITTKDEMEALEPGSRSFGQFSSHTWWESLPADDPSPTLLEMSEKAIDLLNADNENGFFLMIEGAHIDKNSHSSSDDGVHYPKKVADTAWAVKGFDNTIKMAVEFARADGHTLVVVTADHETGDIYEENGVYTFHSASHTGNNVPLFVYGADDLFKPGEAVKNSSIPGRVAQKLGWRRTEFPHVDAGSITKKVLDFFTFQWMVK